MVPDADSLAAGVVEAEAAAEDEVAELDGLELEDLAGAEALDGVGVGEGELTLALADDVAWEGLEELELARALPWTTAEFWPEPRWWSKSILSSSSGSRIRPSLRA